MVLTLSLHLTIVAIFSPSFLFFLWSRETEFSSPRGRKCAILLKTLFLTNWTGQSVSAPVAFVPLPYSRLFLEMDQWEKYFLLGKENTWEDMQDHKEQEQTGDL